MALPWNNCTSDTTYGWRGSSCIYWIGIFHFHTFLTLFCFDLLYCHSIALHFVQYRAFLEDDKQKMAVCTHFSCLDASQLTQWYLASHPFHLLQPTHHHYCHCHEASTKKGILCLSYTNTASSNASPGGWSWREHCIHFASYTSTEVVSLLKPLPRYKMVHGSPSTNWDTAVTL